MPFTLPKHQTRVAEIERRAEARGDRSAAEYKHRAAVDIANAILDTQRFAKDNTFERTVTRAGQTVTKLYTATSPMFYLDTDSGDANKCYSAQVKYERVRTYEKRAFVPKILGLLAVRPGTLEKTTAYSITRFESGMLQDSGYEQIDVPSVIPAAPKDLSVQPEAMEALDTFLQDAEYIATQNRIQVIPRELFF